MSPWSSWHATSTPSSKSSPGSLAGITGTGVEVDATPVNGRVGHLNQRCQCRCDVHRLDRQILFVARMAGAPEHNGYTAVVVPRRAMLRYVEAVGIHRVHGCIRFKRNQNIRTALCIHAFREPLLEGHFIRRHARPDLDAQNPGFGESPGYPRLLVEEPDRRVSDCLPLVGG